MAALVTVAIIAVVAVAVAAAQDTDADAGQDAVADAGLVAVEHADIVERAQAAEIDVRRNIDQSARRAGLTAAGTAEAARFGTDGRERQCSGGGESDDHALHCNSPCLLECSPHRQQLRKQQSTTG